MDFADNRRDDIITYARGKYGSELLHRLEPLEPWQHVVLFAMLLELWDFLIHWVIVFQK
jgi:hypothetical protein